MADPQLSSSDSSARVLPGERNQYPVDMAVDFTRLKPNALRRYLAFHGIPEVPGSSRDQLAVAVARHFGQECKKTDESSSISSFVTYLKGSSEAAEAADILRSRPKHTLKRKKQNDVVDMDDKENQNRQVTSAHENIEAVLAEEDIDEMYDFGHADGLDLRENLRPLLVKMRRPANHEKKFRGSGYGRGRADSGDAGAMQKKKKRKGRLYCICKGGSFGDMIACDNKKCLDRSNWYHMNCVGLEEPPETWYCPACQENDSADIPENQYRKPVASVTYGDMISHALTVLPGGKGSFKEICDFVETEYESQLNWKLESDQRKSPVWRSSVRKILFSNVRFQKHPQDKGMFCLAA